MFARVVTSHREREEPTASSNTEPFLLVTLVTESLRPSRPPKVSMLNTIHARRLEGFQNLGCLGSETQGTRSSAPRHTIRANLYWATPPFTHEALPAHWRGCAQAELWTWTRSLTWRALVTMLPGATPATRSCTWGWILPCLGALRPTVEKMEQAATVQPQLLAPRVDTGANVLVGTARATSSCTVLHFMRVALLPHGPICTGLRRVESACYLWSPSRPSISRRRVPGPRAA